MLLDEPVEASSDNQVRSVKPGHELVVMNDQDFLPVDFYRIYIVLPPFFGSILLKNGFMKGLYKKSTGSVI